MSTASRSSRPRNSLTFCAISGSNAKRLHLLHGLAQILFYFRLVGTLVERKRRPSPAVAGPLSRNCGHLGALGMHHAVENRSPGQAGQAGIVPSAGPSTFRTSGSYGLFFIYDVMVGRAPVRTTGWLPRLLFEQPRRPIGCGVCCFGVLPTGRTSPIASPCSRISSQNPAKASY